MPDKVIGLGWSQLHKNLPFGTEQKAIITKDCSCHGNCDCDCGCEEMGHCQCEHDCGCKCGCGDSMLQNAAIGPMPQMVSPQANVGATPASSMQMDEPQMGAQQPQAPQAPEMQVPTHRHYGHTEDHPVHLRHRSKSQDPLHKEEDKLVVEWKNIADEMAQGNVDPQAAGRLQEINQRLKTIQKERHMEALKVLGEQGESELGTPEETGEAENEEEVEEQQPVQEQQQQMPPRDPRAPVMNRAFVAKNCGHCGMPARKLAKHCGHCGEPMMEETLGVRVKKDWDDFDPETHGQVDDERLDHPHRSRMAKCPDCGSDDIDEGGACRECGYQTPKKESRVNRAQVNKFGPFGKKPSSGQVSGRKGFQQYTQKPDPGKGMYTVHGGNELVAPAQHAAQYSNPFERKSQDNPMVAALLKAADDVESLAKAQLKKAYIAPASTRKSVDSYRAIVDDLISLASKLEKGVVLKGGKYIKHEGSDYWCPASRVHKSSQVQAAHMAAVKKGK